MTATQHLECPQCNRIDMVAKVSAIVAGGSTSGVVKTRGNNATFGLDGSVYLGGTNRTSRMSSLTTQARQLSPPVQPALGMKVADWVGGCFLVTIITGAGIVILAKPLANVFALAIIGMILALAISAAVTFTRYKQREEELYAEISSWEMAMARWNRLFYCSRCDGVFDTSVSRRRLIPTSEMTHYIWH